MSNFAISLGVWAPSLWFLISLLLGYLLLQALEARRPPKEISLSESLFRSLAAGFLVIVGLALALAELGWFRLRWILGALALVFLLALFWAWRCGASWRLPHPQREDLLPLALILITAVLAFRPHTYVLGIGDQGTYPSIAGSIARQESIGFFDFDVAALDPLWAQEEFFFRSPWTEEATPRNDNLAQFSYLTGFNLDNDSYGKIVPSFLHLFPTWLALNYKLGDMEGMLQAVPWLGLLSILAVYFAGRALLNRRVAFIGALFLSVNLVFTWIHRAPTAEGLSQALLFILLYGLARHYNHADRGAEILAALSLGALVHTQIEALLILGAVAIWLFWILWQKPARIGQWRAFIILAGLQLLHFVVYARTIAWNYVTSTLWTVSLYISRPPLVLALLPLAAFGIGLGAFGIRRGWLSQYNRRIRLALIGSIATLALLAYFVYPVLSPPQTDLSAENPDSPMIVYEGLSLAGLNWYLTPWSVWMGITGLLLFLWRGRLSHAALLLGPVLTLGSPYLYMTVGSAEHVRTTHLFYDALIPGFLLGAAYLLEQSWITLPDWKGRLVPLLLGGYLLAATGIPTITLAVQRDYRGAIGVLRQIAKEVEEEDIILFTNRSEGLAFGTPLWSFFDRQVFILQQDEPDTAALRVLVEEWENQGQTGYLIAPQDTDGVFLRDFSLTKLVVFSPQFAHLEQTTEHPPRHIERMTYSFTLYRLHPLPALTPGQEISIDIGSDDHPYIGQGFYQKERSGDGRTFRWTESEAEIKLPGRWFCSQGSPTLTLILAQYWASEENPSTVSVGLGETVLGQITPPQSWQAVLFRIPEMLGPQFCQQDVVPLRLFGPTRRPSSTGRSVDSRSLGIALDQIIFTLP